MKLLKNGWAGSPSLLKAINGASLSAQVRGKEVFTKPQLAKETGLSLVTVNKIIDEKVASGEILCTGILPSSGGRKAKSYCFNENHQTVLVLFIQEGVYRIALMNLAGEILCQKHIHHTNQDWTRELIETIDSLLAVHREKNITAIGIAVPGTVDGGSIYNIPSIPQWEGLSLQALLQQSYPQDIIVENDIHLTALGIRAKKFMDMSNMVLLHLQQGVRASIIIDGKLHKGRHNFAGEISFMRISPSAPNPSMEEQTARLIQEGRAEELIRLITPLLVNIVCIIEPDCIAVETYSGGVEFCERVRYELEKYIEKKYIPIIQPADPSQQLYFYGAYTLWVEKFPYFRGAHHG